MLELTDLEIAYGPVRAVRGISLRVAAGQLVALVGANGAGKSTTLAAISGLVRPAAGHLAYLGRDLTRLSPTEIVRLGIAHVPEGRAILSSLSVEENLVLGGYHRRDRAALKADMESMMERFPVLGRRRLLPAGGLSGGEQQMLAIARGLVARPRLLLLDEPSMGLAPRLVSEVFQAVQAIRAAGTTVLLVEQNARRALAIADYAYVLETGAVVLEGPGPRLLDDAATLDAYLGSSLRRTSGTGLGADE